MSLTKLSPSRAVAVGAVAALAIGFAMLSACGDDTAKRENGATLSPGGAGGAGGQGGGELYVGAGGDGAQCTACIGAQCPLEAGVCASDATCLGCASAAPFPAISCFQVEPLNNVLDCLCRECPVGCPQANCGQLPCVRCISKTCSIEYEACSKKPSCSPCTLPDPPSTCSKEPLAVALYLCALETCKDVCDLPSL